MFKDRKIGVKIAAGIGIMIGIFTLVIAISIVNMMNVNSMSGQIKDQNIPMIHKAQDIGDATSKMMLEMRGFIYTGSAERMAVVETEILEIQKYLSDAKTFAEKNAMDNAVKEGIQKASEQLNSYITLKDQINKSLETKLSVTNDVVAAVTVLYENINKYELSQMDSFKKDLSSDAGDQAIIDRMTKIVAINDIVTEVNMARIYTAKALEARDLTLFDKALAEFPGIYGNVDKMLLVTSKQANKDQLNNIKMNAELYAKGVVTLKTEMQSQFDIATKLLETGNGMIQQTTGLLDSSLKASEEGAVSNVNAGSLTIFLLIGGFILALVIGIFVNFKVIQAITSAIGKITSAAKLIAVGNTDMELTVTSKDEIGELTEAFIVMKDNIKEQTIIVKQIAEGNTQMEVAVRSENDLLNMSLQMAIENINAIINEISTIIQSVQKGNLTARGSVNKFSGSWAEMVGGLNELIEAFVEPINVTSEYVTSIGEGKIPDKITKEYYGDFNNIKQSLNACIESINRLVEDTNGLINAAVEGKLNERADETRHQGEFKEIVKGVNKTLDAVIAPVQEASAVLDEFSRGNLTAIVTGNYKGDHAVIKTALNSTITAISGYIREITHTLDLMGEGNLNVGITADYKGDFVQMKNAINNIVDSLNEVLGEINMASEQVATGSRQVAQSSQALSHGSTMQASSIEEITASMTEISEQTKENAINASKANEFSVGAKDAAAEGSSQMVEMVTAMKEINESSVNISKIISVIDEIAFQTNILALNAAVEAARAGQHGKGFAVVAEEVRNLAARSANAAKETTVLIENSVTKVGKGVKIAEDTAKALEGIVGGVSKAADLVANIAYASNEQATAISQINEGIYQVSQVVQNNTATAEESAAASEEMTSQAQMLKEMVGRFKLKGQHRSYVAPVPKKEYAKAASMPSSDKIVISLDDDEFGKY